MRQLKLIFSSQQRRESFARQNVPEQLSNNVSWILGDYITIENMRRELRHNPVVQTKRNGQKTEATIELRSKWELNQRGIWRSK